MSPIIEATEPTLVVSPLAILPWILLRASDPQQFSRCPLVGSRVRDGLGRGDWNRTSDNEYPKLVLYQAELHPDIIRQEGFVPAYWAIESLQSSERAGLSFDSS